MAASQGTGGRPDRPEFPRWPVTISWLIVILSMVFAALIFVIPLDEYRLLGHIFEAAASLFCMACCLYLYRNVSDRLILLLAAFAFFSYALTTTFWYLYTVALGRMSVFTTVAEFGFLCFFFFFIAAFSIGFPDRGMRPSLTISLLLLFLAVPLIISFEAGDRQPVHLALITVRFLVIGLLVTTALRHGIHHSTFLWAGICLRCFASMLYGVRETLFTVYPVPLFPATAFTAPLTAYDFLSVVGPMIICSYALILLGLIAHVTGNQDSPVNG
jgi:hypothetical protein